MSTDRSSPVGGELDDETLRLRVAQAIAKTEDTYAKWDLHWGEESRTRFLYAADAAIRAVVSSRVGDGDAREAGTDNRFRTVPMPRTDGWRWAIVPAPSSTGGDTA